MDSLENLYLNTLINYLWNFIWQNTEVYLKYPFLMNCIWLQNYVLGLYAYFKSWIVCIVLNWTSNFIKLCAEIVISETLCNLS